eukprot:9794393-Lingulodinium_polyedra.AAC.1
MDRAIGIQARLEQLRSPCPLPASAWRRLRSATWHVAPWTCGLFKLVQTCGHDPRYPGSAPSLRATALVCGPHFAGVGQAPHPSAVWMTCTRHS